MLLFLSLYRICKYAGKFYNAVSECNINVCSTLISEMNFEKYIFLKITKAHGFCIILLDYIMMNFIKVEAFFYSLQNSELTLNV